MPGDEYEEDEDRGAPDWPPQNLVEKYTITQVASRDGNPRFRVVREHANGCTILYYKKTVSLGHLDEQNFPSLDEARWAVIDFNDAIVERRRIAAINAGLPKVIDDVGPPKST